MVRYSIEAMISRIVVALVIISVSCGHAGVWEARKQARLALAVTSYRNRRSQYDIMSVSSNLNLLDAL